MFTASGLRVRFLKVCRTSVDMKPCNIWDENPHVIHFPGLGEERLQHCWVGSLHHESRILRDKVLVTDKIFQAQLNSYFKDPQRSSCMIIKHVYCDTTIFKPCTSAEGAGQGRPDSFPLCSSIHCSLGYLFSPSCPVCLVGSIFVCIFGASVPCWSIYTPYQFVLFFALNGWVVSLGITVYKHLMHKIRYNCRAVFWCEDATGHIVSLPTY